MNYFAVFLPMLSAKKSEDHRQEHLDFLTQQESEGRVFAKGPFLDGSGGLVIYKGESVEEIQRIVIQDPYVKIGARGYEIHEWAMKTV